MIGRNQARANESKTCSEILRAKEALQDDKGWDTDYPAEPMQHRSEFPASLIDMTAGQLGVQIIELLLIALPIASISWTITHEEVFREPREFCTRCSKQARHVIIRKFFYLFTCEYCFSHWVSALFLFITRYKLIFPDWRGYLLGLFALVWMANQYMSIFDRLRLNIKRERVEIKSEEQEVKRKTETSRAA